MSTTPKTSPEPKSCEFGPRRADAGTSVYGSPSSASVHRTFWVLLLLVRPHTVSACLAPMGWNALLFKSVRPCVAQPLAAPAWSCLEASRKVFAYARCGRLQTFAGAACADTL